MTVTHDDHGKAMYKKTVIESTHHDMQPVYIDYFDSVPSFLIEQGEDIIEISPEMMADLIEKVRDLQHLETK